LGSNFIANQNRVIVGAYQFSGAKGTQQ